jgi:RNA polymerase sigma-70 factor, ECF subfamily
MRASMTDAQLQRRFAELLQEHRKIVFKIAAVYARGAEDRRDLEQEICTQLWRSFGRYDKERAKFSTWMYRIALNVAISEARRKHRSQPERFEPLEERHLETIGAEPDAEPDERLQALYAFIGRLDPLNRALILLYLEEKSYSEIAEVLGISETNVATKLGRIKQKLRSRMTKPAAAVTGA